MQLHKQISSRFIIETSNTHRQLFDAEPRDAGIGPGTVRLSIGIEDSGDLILDLADILAKIQSINAA